MGCEYHRYSIFCDSNLTHLLLTDRVRERLKNLLRQYELREKHFDAIIRSKELEVMLSKARVADYKAQIDQLERDRSEIGGGMGGNVNGMGGWSAAENLGGLQRQNNELMRKVDVSTLIMTGYRVPERMRRLTARLCRSCKRVNENLWTNSSCVPRR